MERPRISEYQLQAQSAELQRRALEEFSYNDIFIYSASEMSGFTFSGAMQYSQEYLARGFSVDQVIGSLHTMKNVGDTVKLSVQQSPEKKGRYDEIMARGLQKLAEQAITQASRG